MLTYYTKNHTVAGQVAGFLHQGIGSMVKDEYEYHSFDRFLRDQRVGKDWHGNVRW